MTLYHAGLYLAAATLIVGIMFVPRWISTRGRLSIGFILFIVGCAGIFAALRFDDSPALRSETMAYGWMALCGAALVGGLLFLVTAFFDWLGLTRPPHQRKQFPPFI
jgi:hypothetical protein